MSILKNIMVAIGGAWALIYIQGLLNSKYIIDFLDENLVSLLIALLAINSASLGIVLSKIRELVDANGNGDFSATKKEMLFSIKEQIVLIFLSLVLLMVNDCIWLSSYPKLLSFVEMAVVTCFTYAMIILFDSANSIFVILSFKKN